MRFYIKSSLIEVINTFSIKRPDTNVEIRTARGVELMLVTGI